MIKQHAEVWRKSQIDEEYISDSQNMLLEIKDILQTFENEVVIQAILGYLWDPWYKDSIKFEIKENGMLDIIKNEN